MILLSNSKICFFFKLCWNLCEACLNNFKLLGYQHQPYYEIFAQVITIWWLKFLCTYLSYVLPSHVETSYDRTFIPSQNRTLSRTHFEGIKNFQIHFVPKGLEMRLKPSHYCCPTPLLSIWKPSEIQDFLLLSFHKWRRFKFS